MASSSDLHKPLPEIPNLSQKELAVESRDHLRRFIDGALSQEKVLSWPDGTPTAWADALESALRDLANAIREGDWISGIKLAKDQTRRRKEKSKRAESTREGGELDGDGGRGKKRADAVKQSKDTTKQTKASTEKVGGDSSLHDRPQRDLLALQQLRTLAVKPIILFPSSNAISQHLLLTVDLFEEHPPKSPIPGAHRPAPRCTFSPNKFTLPKPDLFGEDPAGNEELATRAALYGFKEWIVDENARPDPLRLVGGCFSFQACLFSEEYDSLVKVLRLSIFVLLSLLLEESFLMDAHIQLHFPKHVHAVPFPSRPPIHRQPSSTDTKHKLRDSFLSTSIWSMLTKKTGSFLHRTAVLTPNAHRGGSMDLPHPPPTTPVVSTPADDLPFPRQRRFSFFGESRTPALPVVPTRHEEPLFQSAQRQLEEFRDCLSTSIGVSLPTPALISRLASKERDNPARKLTGEEKTGLSSILGWEGKKSRGVGMMGTAGFVRQQRLTVLYSEHIPKASRRPSVSSEVSAIASEEDPNASTHCGPRARLRTYLYYSTDDISLGDMVTDMCVHANEPCVSPGCPALRGQHGLQWLHNGIRIQSRVVPCDNTDGDAVLMWEACSECGETTSRSSMSDGAYLFSFAKFLELLLYSPTICTLAQPLCPHTTPPPRPWSGLNSPLPQSRFHIVRRFMFQSHTVSFSLSPIEDIFELRVPRLQIARGSWHDRVTSDGSKEQTVIGRQELEGGRDKRALRKEIKHWWQVVAEYLDKLEALFVDDRSLSHIKSLPRLPSTDQDWEDDFPTTPKAIFVPLPSNNASSPSVMDRTISSTSTATAIPLPRSQSMPEEPASASVKSVPEGIDDTDALSLLAKMRFAFQKTEQELYSQLGIASDTSLNNMRRLFHSAGTGAKRRLLAWEVKHIPKEARDDLAQDRQALQGPTWWGETFHAVSGSNIIIKEEDWGSIIAFTLSSVDYQYELTHMSRPGPERQDSSSSLQYPTFTSLNTISPALSTASESSFKFFSRPPPKPDPDSDETVWHEPETCSAVITRKEHPRDPTALLSLREVLRHRAPTDGSNGLPPSILAGMSRIVSGTPPSAWAKPAVEVNTHAADGQVTTMTEAGEKMGKILHDMDAASVASSAASQKTSSEAPSSGFLETHIQRRNTSSVVSAEDSGEDSDSTTTGADTDAPPAPLPKDSVFTTSGASQTSSGSDPQSSSFSWGSLTNAMRYMIKPTDPFSRPMSPILKNNINYHGLLYADPLAIDARPHIKYDWTIGKRLKFSCTVYYAKQFDALRRQCGIENVFLSSMARSENWSADGGKSRSNFWKTADDRFIIKTLLNAWNVADLQVLIELAPSYFRHMEATASKASVLAKLLGFYTVEIRNLETGTVQSKADLLVMENLFYNQNVSKTFDLKGIQGRKVKATPGQSPSKTLFDGEWIEGQERALTLVHPHSKVILREGLRSDCDFLAKSNIMDYSLLLGIDEKEKEISCGLVDTIGSYTFAKTLEYKAKQGFSGKEGKQVTVMPPNEYQERFVTTLDSYFLACPDKWTKPPNDKKASYDYTELPSVL